MFHLRPKKCAVRYKNAKRGAMALPSTKVIIIGGFTYESDYSQSKSAEVLPDDL